MTLAVVFPGQASQQVGMGVALRATSPTIDALFALADQVTGLPIGALCAHGPLDELTRTDVAQVAVVVTSMAASLCFEACMTGRPGSVGVAGHSVGELTALWWAAALDTETVLHLVHERGRLMARDSTSCDGGMSAVLGLGETELQSICSTASAQTGGRVQIANLNAPGQVVLSGDRHSLTVAAELAHAAGARRVLALNVGGPFHSTYMDAAARDFRRVVAAASVHRAKVPIVLNTTGQPTTDPDVLREELSSQIIRSVRWEDSLRQLARMGCHTCLELGPGQILTGMARRTLPDIQAMAAGDPEAIAAAAALITADITL